MKIVKVENGGCNTAAIALLLAAVFAPILLRPGSLPSVPDWTGAAVSALCLLGGLWKLAQAGRVNRVYIFGLVALLALVLVWSQIR
ncbi:MAG: hypothetical protein H6R19_85 [Proteobacteria bacterium]|nr:hypothetical protein [Pseudomonadota bacterium]